jgi:hypothetical protein
MGRGAGRARVALAAALAAAACACAKAPQPDPRYRPTESVLEVVAVLRRHVPDDTYRFPPARDFTGRNVYRASLLRLENLERAHADALRAGTLDDVIGFAKARALERIRAFGLAAASYRKAAEREGPLRLEALRGAAFCDALAEAAGLGAGPRPQAEEAEPEELGMWAAEQPVTPHVASPPALAEVASEPPLPDVGSAPPPAVLPAGPTPEADLTGLEREAALRGYDARIALLEAVLPEAEGTHYAAVIREELERADVARARFLVDVRRLQLDGDVRALAALQQVVVKHRESKNTNTHLLALADLYAALAAEYVQTHPPESLHFDPPRFEELVESAARLYEAIANQDGASEKLEAARRLEAFLAFTLKVDRDRFAP